MARTRTRDFDIKEFMRPTVFVPESKRLNVLLREFRRSRVHMAIVADEYGGIAGLVTIEDVIEQIVGDIDDEHDIDEDVNIRKDGERQYIVRGQTPIDEFNEYFQTELSDDEFDTVAGPRHEAVRPPAAPRRDAAARGLRSEGHALRPAAHRHAAADRAARHRAARRPAARRRVNISRIRRAPLRRQRGRARRGRLAVAVVRAVRAGGRCAVLTPALLMWLWQGATPRRAAVLGFWFNFGTFSVGTYWLYISLQLIGHAPMPLALLLMVGARRHHGRLSRAAGLGSSRDTCRRAARCAGWSRIPAAWLLVEWWRSWFLSGFGWLALGYAHTDNWLGRVWRRSSGSTASACSRW